MKRKTESSQSSLCFQRAVEATPDVSNCFQAGLSAFGKHSAKIILGNNRRCEGSLDIDTCTTAIYPQQNRWDYAFAYSGQVYFVEVHTANSSEVGKLLKKLAWLKDWLAHKAPEINKLRAADNTFVWIQSKRFAIPAHTSQARQLAQARLRPVPVFKVG